MSAGSSHSGVYGRVGFTEGKMKVYHRNGIDDHEPSGTTDFTNSTDWNHFVYVIDGTNGELRGYANGNLEFTQSYDASDSYYNSARQWEIGDISFGASNHNFEGYMDDVAMWNTALTSNQVTELYNSGDMALAKTVASSNLKAYYDFENDSLDDNSGNNKHATSSSDVSFSTDSSDSNAGSGSTPNSVTTDEDTAGTIDLSSYTSDVDGDNLTYSIVSDVSNGSTSLSGSTVTYTPTADYNGTDSFTWKANDGTVDSATGTVNITVTAVNDAPTTDDIATTIDENRTASRSTGITLQGSDVEGDDLTYSIVTDASNGTTSISGSTLTYTVNQDYNGTETITYKANDGSLDSNTSTVTVTITPVNDTPVAVSYTHLTLPTKRIV